MTEVRTACYRTYNAGACVKQLRRDASLAKRVRCTASIDRAAGSRCVGDTPVEVLDVR